MHVHQSLPKVVGALLGVAGASTFASDISNLLSTIAEAVQGNILGSILIGIAATILIWSYRHELLAQMSILTDEHLYSLLIQWLHRKHGYQLLESRLDNQGVFLATSIKERPLIFYKARGSRLLEIVAGLKPSTQDAEIINNADLRERHELRYDLATELLKVGPLVAMIDADEKTWVLNRVELKTRLVADTHLTEQGLLEGAFLVIRGYVMANEVIQRWRNRLEAKGGT